MEKIKKELQEFREFVLRGNVLDLAVGVIIGGAFSKIVSSLVNDVLMPLIGILIGGVDFKNLTLTIGDAKITYGNFIQNVIDFLIVAICIFIFIKIVSKFTKKSEEKEEVKKDEQIILLEEIRDLLKKQSKSK